MKQLYKCTGIFLLLFLSSCASFNFDRTVRVIQNPKSSPAKRGEAMREYGIYYMNEKDDLKSAYHWFYRAANEFGDRIAMARIGWMTMRPDFPNPEVPKGGISEAVKWLKSGAMYGNGFVAQALGNAYHGMYYTGEPDDSFPKEELSNYEAVKWYEFQCLGSNDTLCYRNISESSDRHRRKLADKWTLTSLSAAEKFRARKEAQQLLNQGRKMREALDRDLKEGTPVALFPDRREAFDLDYEEQFVED